MPAHNPSSSRPNTKPLASALILSALLAACGQGGPQDGHGGFPPPAVTYITVAAQDVPVDFEFTGQAAGSREVEIRARVTGVIDKRYFEEGSRVKADQPLFRIDPSPFAAALASADANVATAQAHLKQAERDFARLKPLIEAKAVSQQDYDNGESNLELARAGLKAAQAQDYTARINLGYTDVRAPIAGVIGRALKVEGSLANDQSDSLLATMAQTDPIYVNFALSDTDRDKVRNAAADGTLRLPPGGYQVKLKTTEGRWLDETGKFDFSDYKADTNTGSYSSRAVVPNAKGNVAPGEFLRVVLAGAVRPNAIAVPQRAVQDGPMGKFVYVVGQGQGGMAVAEPHPVDLGEWVRLGGKEPNAWVIKHGLKPGDKLIVDGVARIFAPMTPVQPMTEDEAAKAAQMPQGGQPAAKH